MRRVGRRGAQRPLDHGSNLIVVYRSRSAGANLIKQTIVAILQKSAAPLANRMFLMAKFGRHILARQAVCASQNDAAIVQIAIGKHGDDELVSPNTPVPPHSAPTARLAGLAYLHSP